MITQSEPAGIWVRVSTGGQDEANQEPDISAHVQARGYEVTRKYTLNDKSASKGEQQEKLDEMLEDMRHGVIKVLVCWHSDRLERRGPEYVFRLLAQIRDAGGRVESTKEPLFGTADMSGEAMTALGAVISHQYSVHLSEQVTAALRRIRSNQAAANAAPWGFTLEGEKYNKQLVPTEIAREVIPQIFSKRAAGQSCRQIAEWLDSEGYPSPKGNAHWSEGSIRQIIRNRVYAGRWQTKGKPEQRKTIAYVEPLVAADVWEEANAALRTQRKRGPAKKNAALLANLKCARCGSPMYRIKTAVSPSGEPYLYYRCAGNGPQRKGCGNMVYLPALDVILAVRILMTSTEPHTTRTWVEGRNYDAEIANVRQDIREIANDPLAADFMNRMAAKQAELADLTEKNKTAQPGHWEKREVRKPDGSLLLEGEYFYSLDDDARREYLKTRDIRVEKVDNPLLEPGATRGVRVIIDDVDHGVFPYAPPRISMKK